MTRFIVPVTVLASITIEAADRRSAREAAAHFAQNMGPHDGFADGWNSAQCAGAARVVEVSGFDVEDIDLAEIEPMAETLQA